MHTGHLALLIVAILWPLTVTSYTLNCTPSSAAARGPAARPVVSGRAHVAGHSGAVSGPWCARPSAPWPVPFPPRLPLRWSGLDSSASLVPPHGSVASSVLGHCPTPCLRASPPYPSRVRRADLAAIGPARGRASRVPHTGFPGMP